jgi:hypothetical protein
MMAVERMRAHWGGAINIFMISLTYSMMVIREILPTSSPLKAIHPFPHAIKCHRNFCANEIWNESRFDTSAEESKLITLARVQPRKTKNINTYFIDV